MFFEHWQDLKSKYELDEKPCKTRANASIRELVSHLPFTTVCSKIINNYSEQIRNVKYK